MQEDYYGAYREYLREGMRVEIGIPLSGGGVFRDGAVISESAGDELLVRISRDSLPTGVRIEEGTIVDLSVRVRKDLHTCSAIVVLKQGGRVLRVRLFGAFTLQERRQFFRCSLTLRLKYALVQDGRRRDVERDWEQRRELEQMKFQGYDRFVIAAQTARFTPSVPVEWHTLFCAEATLGGGGIRIGLPERVQPEQLVNLEIQLPLNPPRQVHAVARVVHVMAPRAQKEGGELFPAGMQFVFLDERDRDLIFKQISVTQIEQLRVIADRRPGREQLPAGTPRWQRGVLGALWVVLALILGYYLVVWALRYQQAAPGEIQRNYEKAIREYRGE